MRMILLLAACGALASCIAAPQTTFMGPNGKTVYAVNCETMDDCGEAARDVCPSGHDVIPVAGGTDDTSAKGGLGDRPMRKLAIECH